MSSNGSPFQLEIPRTFDGEKVVQKYEKGDSVLIKSFPQNLFAEYSLGKIIGFHSDACEVKVFEMVEFARLQDKVFEMVEFARLQDNLITHCRVGSGDGTDLRDPMTVICRPERGSRKIIGKVYRPKPENITLENAGELIIEHVENNEDRISTMREVEMKAMER